MKVFRFQDVEYRSHVVADSVEEATKIFDAFMGSEYREEGVEISKISGTETLLISEDGLPPFVVRTVDEWIAIDPKARFL